jgi:hypothetical protein
MLTRLLLRGYFQSLYVFVTIGIARVIVGIIGDLRGQIGRGNWTKMNRTKEGNEKEDRRNEVRLT